MKLWIAALLIAFGLLHGQGAQAQGLEKQMQKTLGQLVNTTDPSFSMSARRGVISGGSFTVRNKIMNTSLVNFQMPYAHAGCGGWDLFGGSFSFISSEQIVAMLRSIASSAVSYAFHLALSTISEKVDNILTALQDKMDMVNQQQINSCKVGMAIVDAFRGNGEAQAGESKGANFLAALGLKNDDSDASKQGDNTSPAVDAANADPGVRDAVVQGNLVWKALQTESAKNWMDGADDEFLKQVMSLTGTVIVCVRGYKDCAADDGEDPVGQETLISYGREPILTFADLVEGTQSGNEVSIYQCASDECLNPKAVVRGTFTGAEKMVLDLVLGTCGNYYQAGCGFIGRYAAATGTPSDADKQLMGAFGDYMAMAMRFARTDELAARKFIMEFAPQIAAELVYSVTDEALNSALQAATAYKGGASKEGQHMIYEARASLREDYRRYMETHSVDTTRFVYFRALMDEMDKTRGILPTAAGAN